MEEKPVNVYRMRPTFFRSMNRFDALLAAGVLALISVTWFLSRFEAETVLFKEKLPTFMLVQEVVVKPGVVHAGKSAAKVSDFVSISKEPIANSSLVIQRNQVALQSVGELDISRANETASPKAGTGTSKTAMGPPPALVPPTLMNQIMPSYPPEAVEKGLHGTTSLKLLVGTSGQVDDVQVEASSGSDLLDHSAISAAHHWKFAPARLGTAPVQAWFRLPVRFEIKG